jgi:pimeloyl-ACP methyl ester carboxylesterase
MNLLLLPGLLCDRAAWAPVLPHVQDVAGCSIPDYADETSLGAMAERVLASAPPTFAVAGHSMGGRVALEIVRRAPERVERLALLDTGCHARPSGAAGDAERAGRLALLASAREHGMRTMARTWVQPMVHPGRLADPVLIDVILDMFARRTPQQFAGQIEALLARPDATDVLRAVRCPALVLCGRADRWAPPEQHEEMAALMPGGRLEILDRCGHMAPMERPDAVGAALAEWLQATPDSGVPRQSERPDPAHDMIA